MNSISNFGSFDALAHVGPARAEAAGTAARAGAWFDNAGAGGSIGTSASLRAEVEPDARGLSVAQHADRVLAQLVEALPATGLR